MSAVFVDPPDLRERGDVDLGDPFERAAIALYTMTWNTPADAARLIAGDMKELIPSWIGPGMTQATRMMYRQRAAVVLRAYGIDDEALAA